MYDDHFLGGVIKAYLPELKENLLDSDEELQVKASIRENFTKRQPLIHTAQAGILHAQDRKFIHEQEAVKYFRKFTRPKYPEAATPSNANVMLMVKGEQQLDEIWQAWTKHVEEHMNEKKGIKHHVFKCLGIDLGEIPRTKPVTVQHEPVLKTISAYGPKIQPQADMAFVPWDCISPREKVSKKELLVHHSPKDKPKT